MLASAHFVWRTPEATQPVAQLQGQLATGTCHANEKAEEIQTINTMNSSEISGDHALLEQAVARYERGTSPTLRLENLDLRTDICYRLIQQLVASSKKKIKGFRLEQCTVGDEAAVAALLNVVNHADPSHLTLFALKASRTSTQPQALHRFLGGLSSEAKSLERICLTRMNLTAMGSALHSLLSSGHVRHVEIWNCCLNSVFFNGSLAAEDERMFDTDDELSDSSEIADPPASSSLEDGEHLSFLSGLSVHPGLVGLSLDSIETHQFRALVPALLKSGSVHTLQTLSFASSRYVQTDWFEGLGQLLNDKQDGCRALSRLDLNSCIYLFTSTPPQSATQSWSARGSGSYQHYWHFLEVLKSNQTLESLDMDRCRMTSSLAAPLFRALASNSSRLRELGVHDYYQSSFSLTAVLPEVVQSLWHNTRLVKIHRLQDPTALEIVRRNQLLARAEVLLVCQDQNRQDGGDTVLPDDWDSVWPLCLAQLTSHGRMGSEAVYLFVRSSVAVLPNHLHSSLGKESKLANS